MIRRLLSEERGYSLVEVMASIIILAIAILPLVGMFDMGLKSATTGGNYDMARKLADTNLDKVRALPYADARVAYTPGTPVSCDEGIFEAPRGSCEVTTTYVDNSLNANPDSTTRMQVTVTVEWDDNKSYTTTGLIAR